MWIYGCYSTVLLDFSTLWYVSLIHSEDLREQKFAYIMQK